MAQSEAIKKFNGKARLATKEVVGWANGTSYISVYDNYIVVSDLSQCSEPYELELDNAVVAYDTLMVNSIGESKVIEKQAALKYVDKQGINSKFTYKQGFVATRVTINNINCTRIQYTKKEWQQIYVTPGPAIECFIDNTMPDFVVYHDLVSNFDDSLAALATYIDQNKDQIITLDCETFGLDEHNFDGLCAFKGRLRLLQLLAENSDTVHIWDFGERDSYLDDVKMSKVREACKLFQNITVRCHRALFDGMWMALKLGINIDYIRFRDTLVMSKIFWSGIITYNHGLGDVAKRVGVECHDKALQKCDWGNKLYAPHFYYAAGDVVVTKKTDHNLQAIIDSEPINNQDHINDALRALPMVISMNLRGYPVDSEKLDKVLEKAERDLEELIYLFQFDTNGADHAKNEEVIAALRNEFGIEVDSTSQDVMQECQHAVTNLLIHIRALEQRVNYMRALKNSMVDEFDNRAFTQYDVVNPQASGRMTASSYYTKKKGNVTYTFGFNGLNPSKDNNNWSDIPSIRELFAVLAGLKLTSTDLSGAHLRIALFLCGQFDVLDQMTNSDDGHAHTSVSIAVALGGKYEQFNTLEKYFEARKRHDPLVNELRNLAKTGIYSVINICSAASLQVSFREREIFLSLEDCKKVLEGLWNRVPKIKTYVNNVAANAVKSIDLVTPNCRKPTNSYEEFRKVYPEWKEKKKNELLRQGKDKKSKAVRELSDKPIGFARIVSHAGRHRFFPIYENASRGARPRVYRSVSKPAIASHCWASVESTIMFRATTDFHYNWTLQGNPDCRIWAIPYDECCTVAPEHKALPAVTYLSECMKHHWEIQLPGVPGVTDDPETMIGDNWNLIH